MDATTVARLAISISSTMVRRPSSTQQKPYFTRNFYPMEKPWDIPILKTNTSLSFSNLGVMPFDETHCRDTRGTQKIVHFFITDDKFESVYYYPEHCIEKISQYDYILTPDFSLYTDIPLSVQLFNTFRNRWCGAFWQELGLSVFPTISWGTKDTFDFCFQGVPQKTIVAISTLGCKHNKDTFLLGYREMLRKLNPELVLCFDTPFPEMEKDTVFIDYERFSKKEGKTMGGRGSDSRYVGPEQLNFALEVEEKVMRAKAQAQTAQSNEIDTFPPIALRACMCCGEYTIPVESEYEKCPVCGWIDDPHQNVHPDEKEGMNPISLNEARSMYTRGNPLP
jgi:hypothetical protein